jgi:hypothetical protein
MNSACFQTWGSVWAFVKHPLQVITPIHDLPVILPLLSRVGAVLRDL